MRTHILQMPSNLNVQLPPTRLAKAGLKYLERGHSSFLVADTDGLIHFIEEDFAISDFPSGRVLDNGVDGGVDEFILQHQFQLNLGQKIDAVLAATIGFGMSLLPAVPADL